MEVTFNYMYKDTAVKVRADVSDDRVKLKKINTIGKHADLLCLAEDWPHVELDLEEEALRAYSRQVQLV